MTFFRFGQPLDPVSRLLTLQRRFDRAFERAPGNDPGFASRGVFPPVNITGDKDGYVVSIEVPGVSPEHLTIETEGRTLKVSGTREVAAPAEARFHRQERAQGEFSRALQLPEDLDAGRAEASYALGILTIRIPKREETKPRQIAVKAA